MKINHDEVRRLVEMTKDYPVIFDTFEMAEHVLSQHEKIMCSVSGGSDSDVVVDILTKLDPDKQIHYVWFDTGVEYAATKEHLDFLENKYGITIERVRPYKTIPWVVKMWGQPFLSKTVSRNIERLQRNNFQWEDEPYEVLIQKYPKCQSPIRWWCNKYTTRSGALRSVFNISNNGRLKDFLIQNPPWFRISAECCDSVKKKTARSVVKQGEYDLEILGVRVFEGGIRKFAYDQCYMRTKKKGDLYLPILWYNDQDKADYCNIFGVTHSRCYTQYGFQRTGCVCCPFSKDVLSELEVIDVHEPKIAVAAKNIFADSYKYTRMWLEFRSRYMEEYIAEKHPRIRSVRCVETGEVFKRISDVYDKMGISVKSISNNLRGVSKSAGGFHWEYADDKDYNYGTWGAEEDRHNDSGVKEHSLKWRFQNDSSRMLKNQERKDDE